MNLSISKLIYEKLDKLYEELESLPEIGKRTPNQCRLAKQILFQIFQIENRICK